MNSTKASNGDDDEDCVWRFGYGSNIALSTLRTKKNLNPRRHLVGTITGWELYFSPAIPYVEPGFAKIRPVVEERNEEECNENLGKYGSTENQLHGSAFLIPRGEADGLDRQEASYRVHPSRFVSYDGDVIEGVGLYVPKKYIADGRIFVPDSDGQEEPGVPSLRYLQLMQRGAREAELSESWIKKLDAFDHYVTPDDVRDRTLGWIREFHDDPERSDCVWTMEELSRHDGSEESRPPHVAVMQYVARVDSKAWVFASWKGHCVTRRNLLHFRGQSLDVNDIRWNEDGFRPLPKVSECSDEEREYLLQNLETLLHRGGTIVAKLKECIDDGGEMECVSREL
mmetsp:Transcript_48764/g.103681  ORF Transcript_48764/g.103681 Transcript_48764/m.103681 type:complete len:341 (-) Transcript_48764:72-1094(-)